MILETQRLVLDQWQISDWIELRPNATDPKVMRHITGGMSWTDCQIRSFVERQVKFCAERGDCRWKLLAKPALEMVGFSGVGLWHDASDPEKRWPFPQTLKPEQTLFFPRLPPAICWRAEPHLLGKSPATRGSFHCLAVMLPANDWTTILPSRTTNVSVPNSYTLSAVSAVQRM
jgi:hypothetical protein